MPIEAASIDPDKRNPLDPDSFPSQSSSTREIVDCRNTPELSLDIVSCNDIHIKQETRGLSGRGFRDIMVSKCANPKCRAVFRYLHEGKLFEFEVRTLDELSAQEPRAEHHENLTRDIECFWLCASCALAMTLVREPHTDKVALVPFHQGVEGGGDVGDAPPANPWEQRWL